MLKQVACCYQRLYFSSIEHYRKFIITLNGRKTKLLIRQPFKLAGIAHTINCKFEEGSRRRTIGFNKMQIIQNLFIVKLCRQNVIVKCKVRKMPGIISKSAGDFCHLH